MNRNFRPSIVGAFAVVLLALCVVGIAQAQTTCPKVSDDRAHVCWTAPTTNTNGTAITGAITYTVQGQAGATWTNVATGVTATDWTSAVLAPGTYTYRVIATVAANDSAPAAASGNKVVPAATPNPPGGVTVAQVTVTISSPAFRIIGQYPHATPGEFVAMVAAGRDCSGPILFRKHGYSFRQVIVLPSEAWQSNGPAPKTAAAPCVRLAT